MPESLPNCLDGHPSAKNIGQKGAVQPAKKIAIVQSNYIPWRGYFDLISRVDEFILFDDAQYTKRDWRNRNRIKTATGLQWLTIPVTTKGTRFQTISEVHISDRHWARKHWNALVHTYSRSEGFREYGPVVREWYLKAGAFSRLSEVNRFFLTHISTLLGGSATFSSSLDYGGSRGFGGKTERLVSLCEASRATHYFSGPAARDYLIAALFSRAEIKLSYMNYDGYSAYPQRFGAFESHVSIMDLLFNVGSRARDIYRLRDLASTAAPDIPHQDVLVRALPYS